MNIYQKLHHIQTKINGLAKDKKSNTYTYVTGSKVLEHIKPLMNELGLILKQEVLSIDNERQDYKTGIGTQYEKPKSEILSKVMMRFTWVDVATGETDINLFGANGQNDWEKGLGSALTYAERYFLLKYFHIATDEDDIDNDSRKADHDNKQTDKPFHTRVDNTANRTIISLRNDGKIIDIEGAKAKLIVSGSLKELEAAWKSLSKDEQSNKEIIDFTNTLKAKLK